MSIIASILSKSITEDHYIYGQIGLFEYTFTPDNEVENLFWCEYEVYDKEGNYPFCRSYPITEKGINNALWEMLCTLDEWCAGERRLGSCYKAGFPH